MIVQILNPVPGGATHIGLKRAQRYIKSGCAVLIGGKCLRFNEAHHARKAAQVSAVDPRHTDGGYQRASGGGILPARDLMHIPVVNGHELLAPRGKRRNRPMFMRASDVNFVPRNSPLSKALPVSNVGMGVGSAALLYPNNGRL